MIYIASPYTKGVKLRNVHRSMDAADELIEMGLVPYLPLLTHFWDQYSPKPYAFWLEYDLQVLRHCKALLRLPGESYGADQEIVMANLLHIPIYGSIDELRLHLGGQMVLPGP